MAFLGPEESACQVRELIRAEGVSIESHYAGPGAACQRM